MALEALAIEGYRAANSLVGEVARVHGLSLTIAGSKNVAHRWR